MESEPTTGEGGVKAPQGGGEAPKQAPPSPFSTDHLLKDLKGRSVRGGAVTVTSQAGLLLIRILGTAVLARLLTPAHFGLIAMVTPIAGFVGLFRDLGLSMATVQWKDLRHEQVSTLFWINVAASAVLMLIVLALSPVVGWFYGEPRVVWIMAAHSFLFLCSGFTAQHVALIRRQMRFGRLAAMDLTSWMLAYLVGIAAAYAGFGYWSLVFLAVAQVLIQMAMAWRLSAWRPGLPRRRTGVGPMLRFGGNLIGFNAVNYLSRNLDNVLIGKVWGQVDLGFYAKAYGIMLLPLGQLNVPLTGVAIPALSRLADDPEKYRRAYLGITSKIAMLTMPAAACAIVASDWLIHVFLGPQWHPAAMIFAFLGISAMVQPLGNTVGWLFVTQGRTREMMLCGWITAAVAILSFLIGLPWGPVGVAACYSLTGLLLRTPISFWMGCRSGPVRMADLARLMILPSAASVAVLLCVGAYRLWFTVGHPLADLLLAVLCGVLATLAVLACTAGGRSMVRDVVDSGKHLFRNNGKSSVRPEASDAPGPRG